MPARRFSESSAGVGGLGEAGGWEHATCFIGGLDSFQDPGKPSPCRGVGGFTGGRGRFLPWLRRGGENCPQVKVFQGGATEGQRDKEVEVTGKRVAKGLHALILHSNCVLIICATLIPYSIFLKTG